MKRTNTQIKNKKARRIIVRGQLRRVSSVRWKAKHALQPGTSSLINTYFKLSHLKARSILSCTIFILVDNFHYISCHHIYFISVLFFVVGNGHILLQQHRPLYMVSYWKIWNSISHDCKTFIILSWALTNFFHNFVSFNMNEHFFQLKKIDSSCWSHI